MKKSDVRDEVTSDMRGATLIDRRGALRYAAVGGAAAVASSILGCGDSAASAEDSSSSCENIESDTLLACEFPSTDSPGVLKPGEGEDVNGMLIKADYNWLSGGFSMMETTIDGKQIVAPHSHQYADQVVVVLGGTGFLEFQFGVSEGEDASDVLRVPAGSYVIKPRGRSHTFWNPGPVPIPYIELSTRTEFQDFVYATAADGSKAGVDAASEEYHTTFYDRLIPELMVKHQLLTIKGMGGIEKTNDLCSIYPCND